jgi:hypothetical protein
MTISDALRAVAVLSLLLFSFYMAEQNKDDRTRKKWKNIIAIIMLVYLTGKFIDEFNLF